RRTATNASTEIPAAAGQSASNAPSPVATPFPPRNPAKTGKLWPRTAATATPAAASGAAYRASITGANPLSASPSNVRTPRRARRPEDVRRADVATSRRPRVDSHGPREQDARGEGSAEVPEGNQRPAHRATSGAGWASAAPGDGPR